MTNSDGLVKRRAMKDIPKDPTITDLMAAMIMLREDMESGFALVAKEFARVENRFTRIDSVMSRVVTKSDLARFVAKLERRLVRLDDRVSALER